MHEHLQEIKQRLKPDGYCYRMLCYLESGGTFTVLEAWQLFGCTSALARVAELRDLGVPIMSIPDGKRVRGVQRVRYMLAEEAT